MNKPSNDGRDEGVFFFPEAEPEVADHRSNSSGRLRTTSKSLLRILNATADGILILDSSGYVVFCNKAANRLLGKEDQDLMGTMFGCPIADGHKTELQITRNGRVRTVEMHVSALDYDNAAAVACLRDITKHVDLQRTLEESNEALKKLNEELVQARDEAIEQHKLKGQFVANISHEIRTPLSGILGLADILLNDCDLDDESLENVRLIQQASAQLLTIVNDILDFSKLEAGHIRLQESVFMLDSLLEEVRDSVLPTCLQKDLTVSIILDSNLPKRLSGDGQKIRQSLLNLAHNAVKFTANGYVRIVAERRSVINSHEVRIKFRVEDSGIGIARLAQESIFQPFVQADGTTTRDYGGTGLGLSITKRFVELMNGQLVVESEPGSGSRFWFELDLKNADGNGGGDENS
jgi:signal transduction histidine kinase